MVYLILIIFSDHTFSCFGKALFYLWKRPKSVKNGCFVVIRWWVGERFVGENNILRLYLSIKKYRFCSVCCTRFWLKSISFSLSYLQNEKHINFCNVFQVYNMETTLLKRFDIYKMQKHVLEAFSYLQNDKKTRFWSVLQVYNMETILLNRFFSFEKWESTFLKGF